MSQLCNTAHNSFFAEDVRPHLWVAAVVFRRDLEAPEQRLVLFERLLPKNLHGIMTLNDHAMPYAHRVYSLMASDVTVLEGYVLCLSSELT